VWTLGPKPEAAAEEILCSGSADGLHSTSANPGPDLRQCRFEGVILDDCIAIHGGYSAIQAATVNNNTVTVDNIGDLRAGEPVRINNINNYLVDATCTAINGNVLTLSTNLSVPADSKISNPLANGPGYKIINCLISGPRSRGILTKGDYGLIQSNTISGCGMSGISCGPEFYWNESDYVYGTVIEGNLLEGNGFFNYGQAALLFHGEGVTYGNRDTTIKNNTFVGNYNGDIIFCNAQIALISNNVMTGLTPWPSGFSAFPVIRLQTADLVTLTNNLVYQSSVYSTLLAVDTGVTGLVGNNSSGIRAMGALTWDGTTNNWNAAHWLPGNETGPTAIGSAATINSGRVTFQGSELFGNWDAKATPALFLNGGTLQSENTFNVLWNLNMGGGTLLANGGATSSVQAFQLAGTLTVTNAGAPSTIQLGGGNGLNAVNVGGLGNNVLTLNVADVTGNANADLTINTPLQNYNNNGGQLLKTGSGTLILSGANTFSGGIRVNQGLVECTADSLYAASGTITVSAGAVLNVRSAWTGNYQASAPLALSGTGNGIYGALNGGENFTLNGVITLSTDSKISHDYNDFTLNGNITGSDRNLELLSTQSGQPALRVNGSIQTGNGTLTKTGAGSVVLAGMNTYTGDTLIQDGTLQLNVNCLSRKAAVRLASGAVLNLNFAGTNLVGALYIGGLRQPVGVYNATSHPGVITGTGALLLSQNTWTNLVSGDASGWWGNSASWSNGIPHGVDAVADFSTLNITADAFVNNDAARTVGQLRFGDTSPSHNWALTNAALTLSVNSETPTVTVNNQTATIDVVLQGTQGFIKDGAGTLTLNKRSTMAGDITVSQGMLVNTLGGLRNTSGSVIVSAAGDAAGAVVRCDRDLQGGSAGHLPERGVLDQLHNHRHELHDDNLAQGAAAHGHNGHQQDL
jgi:autotransporter-associated beta strand protein